MGRQWIQTLINFNDDAVVLIIVISGAPSKKAIKSTSDAACTRTKMRTFQFRRAFERAGEPARPMSSE
jgi:hypothetical protein